MLKLFLIQRAIHEMLTTELEPALKLHDFTKISISRRLC